MKLLRSHRLWLVSAASMQLALLAVALSIPNAHGAERSSKARGDIQAKLDYCKDCHGRSAQGFHGYFLIPRLAGQQPEYLKNQLQAFIEHRRTNNIMFNVAHSLSPAMIDALAADFRELNPPPLGGGPRRLVPTGEKIFQNGVPETNFAACAACHGPEAQGSGEILLAWPASCPTTPSTNSSTGARNEDSTQLSLTYRRSCRRLHTVLPDRKSKPSPPTSVISNDWLGRGWAGSFIQRTLSPQKSWH